MNAIVAVDKDWGIGKDNDLLVHIPEDLRYFKKKTIEKCVVFGRKTVESLPLGKPLPKRDHIVLTGNRDYTVEARENYACDICHTKEDALELVAEYEAAARTMGEDPEEAVFVCGGAEIYNLFFDECDVFYVTKIDKSFRADRFFPNLDELGFKVTWESEEKVDETTGIKFKFMKYERA